MKTKVSGLIGIFASGAIFTCSAMAQAPPKPDESVPPPGVPPVLVAQAQRPQSTVVDTTAGRFLVTFTPVPGATAASSSAQEPVRDMRYGAPSKSTPQATYAQPAPQMQVVYQAQPVAQPVQQQVYTVPMTQTVEVVQPCALDRAISALGRRMYERGLPRYRMRTALPSLCAPLAAPALSLRAAAPAYQLVPVQAQPTYSTPQQ